MPRRAPCLAAAAAAAAAATPPSPAWRYSCAAGMNVSDWAFDMTGKSVLVTGADGREGFPLSLAAARSGASVVAASRDARTAAETQKRLDAELGGKGGEVRTVAIDLSSFDSVRAGAAAVAAQLPTGALDVLIHNAATASLNSPTADGLVGTMEVNLFAPALLTELLLPALSKAPSPRVVHVSSCSCYDPLGWPAADPVGAALRWSRGDDTLPKGSNYYSLSKFLLIQYAAELAARLPALTSFSVNPGFFRDDPAKYKDQCKPQLLWTPCPQLPPQGATSTWFAAAQPGIESASGSLFDFATSLKDAKPWWVQSGDSCVPRPLPPWDAKYREGWYDAVQGFISNHTSSTPGRILPPNVRHGAPAVAAAGWP